MAAPSAPDNFEHLLMLIGRLNYSWSNTESLLIHLIAGLGGVDKDTAVIIFLTLNTTRARIDLVERLAKLDRVPEVQRERIFKATRDYLKLSGLRNRYNHSIYAFDPESGVARTILMRIADRKGGMKMGRTDELDDMALEDFESAITDLAALNRRVWAMIREFGYPV